MATPEIRHIFKPKIVENNLILGASLGAYLSGMDSLDIMALSGHKTEANFLKYIKVTGKERAKRIAEHKFFQ